MKNLIFVFICFLFLLAAAKPAAAQSSTQWLFTVAEKGDTLVTATEKLFVVTEKSDATIKGFNPEKDSKDEWIEIFAADVKKSFLNMRGGTTHRTAKIFYCYKAPIYDSTWGVDERTVYQPVEVREVRRHK